MTESEYIQQHETYLSSIVSRFIARYPEQRWKMRDDLMQEARIALLIAYRRQEDAEGLERRAYICIIDALYTAAVHAYPIRIPRRKFRKNVFQKWQMCLALKNWLIKELRRYRVVRNRGLRLAGH